MHPDPRFELSPQGPSCYPKKKKKDLHLEHTGKVYWGSEHVGRWEKGVYGTHFFMPDYEEYIAFQSDNLDDFQEDLRLWLEGE